MPIQTVCLCCGISQVPDLDNEVICRCSEDALCSRVELHNGDLVTMRCKSTRRLVHLLKEASFRYKPHLNSPVLVGTNQSVGIERVKVQNVPPIDEGGVDSISEPASL